MSNNPAEIRTDIEHTQNALGRDVDALAEKVDPTKAVGRQKERLRDRLRNAREAVMGTPQPGAGTSSDSGAMQQAGQRAQDMAQQAGQAVQQVLDKVTAETRGNPLAAGLIAFGAGVLAATLLPATRTEQQAAEQVKDRAQPLVDEAKTMAQESGERLKPQAQEAAKAVQESASDSAEQVKEKGQNQAQELKADSQQAAKNVQHSANQS